MKTFFLITCSMVLAATAVFAAECELSNWYISRGSADADWAGSIERVSKNPHKWQVVTNWQLNRTRTFGAIKTEGFAVATLTADAAYTQGICLAEGHVEIRLNGELLEKVPGIGNIWALDLKKGKNTFELKVIPKGDGNRVHLSLCELEYIQPSLEDRVRNTALAIRHLGELFDDYPADRLLKELAVLHNGAPEAQIEAFRKKALVLENPVVDFDRVLFRESGSAALPANWKGNSHYLHRNNRTFSPTFNDRFLSLDLSSGETITVYEAQSANEGLMDICMDWDGDKFLYSGVDPETSTFQLYEISMSLGNTTEPTSPLSWGSFMLKSTWGTTPRRSPANTTQTLSMPNQSR